MRGKFMDKLIKTIRQSAGMNQEQFAKALGTTALSINRWENGKTQPNKMAQTQLFEFCKKNNIDLFDYIAKQVNRKADDDKFIVYHGSKKGISGRISPISREFCDFGKGFYLGTDPTQPLTLICDEEKPVFYTMKFDLTGLKVLNVEMNLEWAMLIAYYRGYMDEVRGSEIYRKFEKMAEGYDVIYGYIANDRMYRVMKSFFEKEITDAALIHSLSALDLGRQYVCKTEKACDRLEIVDKKELTLLELAILRDKSIVRRQQGIDLTEEILLKYRREGKFFDEIMRGE